MSDTATPDTRLTLLMWMSGGLLAFIMGMMIFLFTLVTGVVKDLRADIATLRRDQDRLTYEVDLLTAPRLDKD